MYNHKSDHIPGSTGNGTLRLKSDHHGLKCEIDLPNTQTGRDVGELVRRQDISGMSFAVNQYDQTEDLVEKGVNVMVVKR